MGKRSHRLWLRHNHGRNCVSPLGDVHNANEDREWKRYACCKGIVDFRLVVPYYFNCDNDVPLGNKRKSIAGLLKFLVWF